METGPRLKVSSDRLVKPGIEPVTPGLQGKRLNHYTTAAPLASVGNINKVDHLLKDPNVSKLLVHLSLVRNYTACPEMLFDRLHDQTAHEYTR